jgi:hypothetical protein
VAELASEVVAMRAAIRGLRLELALQQGTEDTAATGGTCGGGGDGDGGGGGGADVEDGDDRVELVLPLRVGRGAGGAPGAAVRPGGWC